MQQVSVYARKSSLHKNRFSLSHAENNALFRRLECSLNKTLRVSPTHSPKIRVKFFTQTPAS